MKPQAFIRDLRIRRNDLHVGMDQIWPVVNVPRIALPQHENDRRSIRTRMIRQAIARSFSISPRLRSASASVYKASVQSFSGSKIAFTRIPDAEGFLE